LLRGNDDEEGDAEDVDGTLDEEKEKAVVRMEWRRGVKWRSQD
jgi:hypothetical protein